MRYEHKSCTAEFTIKFANFFIFRSTWSHVGIWPDHHTYKAGCSTPMVGSCTRRPIRSRYIWKSFQILWWIQLYNFKNHISSNYRDIVEIVVLHYKKWDKNRHKNQRNSITRAMITTTYIWKLFLSGCPMHQEWFPGVSAISSGDMGPRFLRMFLDLVFEHSKNGYSDENEGLVRWARPTWTL